MSERVYNFSAGPATLPLPVLEEAQRDLVALPGYGMSVMEMSHRSKAFLEIIGQTEDRLRRLLAVPDNYKILFLQGGARLQFSMIPMNLLAGRGADYIITGSWSTGALSEARREGPINVAWTGEEHNFDRLPTTDQLQLDSAAAYAYYASNETIQGVQFQQLPEVGDVPLVCDASSDFLSRPLPVERFGLLYACAQKNAGPAGVTVVIVRDDLLACSADELPGMLNYRVHAEKESAYNTPPCFAIYMVGLVAKWLLEDVGGLAEMERRNREKASLLYDALDRSEGFYRGHAQPACRSQMNVTFRLPSQDLEKEFLATAAKEDLLELKGHRSVGGIRASIYNAMPREGVEALAKFMVEFQSRHAAHV